MASWKDYLYFTKAEKRVIILLLVVISILAIACLFTRTKKDITPTQDPEMVKTFEEFRSNLKDTPKPSYIRKLKEGETIDINSADTTTLKTIPGIGSAYAARIVKYRNSLGGFVSKNQLREIWGMTDELHEQIIPYTTIEKNHKRLKINTLSLDELKKHPYINYKQAKVIVDIRTRKGKIKSMNRLSLLDEFSEKDIKRLSPYISFD